MWPQKLDYAHNPDGLEKLCAFIDQMDVPGRRILLCSRGGNRTDQEIVQFTRLAMDHFDHFTCRSYVNLQGRKSGEVPALMRSTLLEAGVMEDLMEWTGEQSNYSYNSLRRVIAALTDPASIGFTEFANKINEKY